MSTVYPQGFLRNTGRKGKNVPDDSIGQIIFDLVIVFIFILINAFFSAAEMAVISLNDAKVKKQAEERAKQTAETKIKLAVPMVPGVPVNFKADYKLPDENFEIFDIKNMPK